MAPRPSPDQLCPRRVPTARLATVLASLLLGACSQVGQEDGIGAKIGLAAPPPAASQSRSELEKATAYWSKEFANNPRNIDAAVNYAKNLKAMGEKDKAIAVLQQASTYNSDHRGLASEYGRLALESDQAQLAEKLLARAEDPLKPDWKVVSARGAAMAKQGRHREAVPLFERALVLSPDNPSIMNNMGMALAMNGEAAKAEGILRRASELPGAPPRVRQNLALVLGLQGKFDEAKEIASADLTPDKADASVAYLRKMVDAAPAGAPTGAKVAAAAPPAKAAKVAAVAAGKAAPSVAALKGTDPSAATAAADSGWATEVARADLPAPLSPPRR